VFVSPMKSVDAAAAYTAWNCVVMPFFGHDQYMSFAKRCRALLSSMVEERRLGGLTKQKYTQPRRHRGSRPWGNW